MIEIEKPARPFKKGDRVLYTPPKNERLSFEGIVQGWYGDDRLLIETRAGHTWALKVNDLSFCKEA